MDDNKPWLPPGHAERLTVGARVRVRLSGECPRSPQTGSEGHAPSADGMAGAVCYVFPHSTVASAGSAGHRFAVNLPALGLITMFAAAELELLD